MMPEAERLWGLVLGRNPRDPAALWGLGFEALRRGDVQRARLLLKDAQHVSPENPVISLALATACREAGDPAAEADAIETALTANPYFLPALLAKAAVKERAGDRSGAAKAYSNALKVAGPEANWAPPLRSQLAYARQVSDANQRAMFTELSRQVSARCGDEASVVSERWREAASVMANMTRPYYPDCNQLLVPRLPPMPFYDRAQFPWIEKLESKTNIIRGELLRALEQDGDRFIPYIDKRAGAPVNQWADLNHSSRWSALHLWQNGMRIEGNLARCPETAQALEEVGLASIAGNCPNAMFSALAPKTRIPPHHGETNARLVAHLPLIVPKNCGAIRVGFEQRKWRVGEVIVFDDSIEHEAWNDSDELRVVLIFDVWNPALSEKDKEMVNALTMAAASFR